MKKIKYLLLLLIIALLGVCGYFTYAYRNSANVVEGAENKQTYTTPLEKTVITSEGNQLYFLDIRKLSLWDYELEGYTLDRPILESGFYRLSKKDGTTVLLYVGELEDIYNLIKALQNKEVIFVGKDLVAQSSIDAKTDRIIDETIETISYTGNTNNFSNLISNLRSGTGSNTGNANYSSGSSGTGSYNGGNTASGSYSSTSGLSAYDGLACGQGARAYLGMSWENYMFMGKNQGYTSDLKDGDVLYFSHRSDGTPYPDGHVAVYIGNGQMFEANYDGQGHARITNVRTDYDHVNRYPSDRINTISTSDSINESKNGTYVGQIKDPAVNQAINEQIQQSYQETMKQVEEAKESGNYTVTTTDNSVTETYNVDGGTYTSTTYSENPGWFDTEEAIRRAYEQGNVYKCRNDENGVEVCELVTP